MTPANSGPLDIGRSTVLKDKVEDAVAGRTGGRHLTDGDAMATDCADEVLLKRQSVATCRGGR